MTWVNTRRQLRCPYCFAPLALRDCDVVAGLGSEDVLRPRPTGLRRLLARFWTQPVRGEEAVRTLASWRCPSCDQLLPVNSDRAESVVIGLIGGAYSGKTHYLAALIQRLESGDDLRGVGCIRFSPLNQETVERYRRDYHDALFERHERLPVTPRLTPGETNRPLIFTLLFEKQRGWRRHREVNMVLYDGSGEQMVIQQELVTFHPYILHAAGLILLVDPLGMPGIGPALPPFLRDERIDTYAPEHMLQSVLTFYHEQLGLRPERLLDLPLAIVMAKADLLRFIPRTLQVPETLRRDSSYTSGYRPAELLASGQIAEEVLRRLGEPELMALTGRFGHVSYHAVSATGGPATAAGKTYPAIVPSRCLDPLFWLLHQVGVIDARRG